MMDDRDPFARARRSDDDAASALAAVGAALVLAGRHLHGADRSAMRSAAGSAAVIGGGAALAAAAGRLYDTVRGQRMLATRLMAMIDWRGDESVVEAGPLPGELAIAAAERLTAGIAVAVAYRNDLEAIRSAVLREADAAGVRSRVAVDVGEPQVWRFADASLDVIICSGGLAALGRRDLARASAEIARVLRPGGTALVIERCSARIARRLAQAGLVVERSGPIVRAAWPWRRIIAATRIVAP